jgi:hypothetical protein
MVITLRNVPTDLGMLVYLGLADWEPDPRDGKKRLTPMPVVVDIATDYFVGHAHYLVCSTNTTNSIPACNCLCYLTDPPVATDDEREEYACIDVHLTPARRESLANGGKLRIGVDGAIESSFREEMEAMGTLTRLTLHSWCWLH